MTTEQTEAQDDGLPRLRTTAAQRAEIKARVIDPATHSLVDDIECLARELDAERNAHTAVWNGLDALTIAHESLRAQLEAARGERDAALKREESTVMHRDVIDQHRCDLERIAQQQTGMITALRADLEAARGESKRTTDACAKYEVQLEQKMQEHQDALSEMRGRMEGAEKWRDQGVDDDTVYFYEREFYPLSNFSAFTLKLGRFTYPTSEHAYQAQKFIDSSHGVWESIALAPSAHAAFKIAEQYAQQRRAEWSDVKVEVMRTILRLKVEQHEYVRRKLMESGTRRLVENSWRDDFWGVGADGKGQNMLGVLWMELRAALSPPSAGAV